MVDCTPDPNLLESMRSVGYSLNTAVADIIDNSIAAHAKTISIRYFDHGEDPYVAIIDDGDGMDYETAVNAMKLAGTNPNAKRNANDLGRFGLGLKTASLSQARSVMLSTVQHGRQNTLRWDLDHVARTREWDLETLDEEQTNLELPRKVRDLMPSTHGTCVLWRNLDRLGNVAGDSLQDIDQAMLELSGYLGLVFHRFLHPYPEDEIERISITVNDEPVPERDPFLVNNLATQRQRMQRIPGTDATLCGYTLPYQNKLTMEDRGLLDLKQEKGHTLFDTQGFYIYRAYRLITWGSWFRLLTRKEATKLSRVQVDIPNNMDDEWTLDIKKSQATPPKTIRDAMKRYVEKLAAPSRRTQQFREGEQKMKSYYDYLEESTNVVKSNANRNKIITILSYLLIWAFAMIVFWFFTSGSDAMGYSLMFLWFILPISTFIVSIVIGKNNFWGKGKWAFTLFFGVMYMLAEYGTFKMANNIAFYKLNAPDLGMIVAGAIISAIGMLVGSLWNKKRHNQKNK